MAYEMAIGPCCRLLLPLMHYATARRAMTVCFPKNAAWQHRDWAPLCRWARTHRHRSPITLLCWNAHESRLCMSLNPDFMRMAN